MAGRRRLRPWLVAQVESGRFAGLEWDDGTRSAVRIPWKHAGKHDHGPRDAAFFQAWAEFKGKLRPGAPPDPAGCKTRLRCALNKSPEFAEVPERSRLDGPRPYKVYRLLPGPAPRGGQPPRRAGPRPRQEAAASPPATTPPEAPAEPRPHGEAAPSPGPDDAKAADPPPDARAPPPAPPLAPPPALPPPSLDIVMESPEPLPPAQGGAALGLRLWLGGALAWRGWLPPGDYLLTPRGDPAPPGGGGRRLLLPRLLLPAPEEPPPAGGPLLAALRPGLLLASTRRGLFVRARGPAPLFCAPPPPHGGGGEPHGGPPQPHSGPLERGAVVQVFDAQRFRREVEQHRAGLGPRPQPRVTLALGEQLGPGDGPERGALVLQLEQAFAQQLLEGPTALPHTA
ncbi:interferon regulatory factor 9-like isoform X2 [Dromaius novaehollandiae]|uniref:interferon regulatory factor 9-like isoform X2 n=1 Tax=Dromaius novaehollandiae TaxID=8790 RepID=UPI00311FF5C9